MKILEGITSSTIHNPKTVEEVEMLLGLIDDYFGKGANPGDVGLAVGYNGKKFCALAKHDEYDRVIVTDFHCKQYYEGAKRERLKQLTEPPKYPNGWLYPGSLSLPHLTEAVKNLDEYEQRFPGKEWGVGIGSGRFNLYTFVDKETAQKEDFSYWSRKELEELLRRKKKSPDSSVYVDKKK